MKALRLYLDEAIERKLVKNDSETARRLEVSRATVSDWRVGRTAPNEDQAAALAALLGKPEILAECMGARAKKPAKTEKHEGTSGAERTERRPLEAVRMPEVRT